MSRLNSSGLIRIENKNIAMTDEGELFFSQNNNPNESYITMQLRFSSIFSKKQIPCKVKYVEYFSVAEYSEAYEKYHDEGTKFINSLKENINNNRDNVKNFLLWDCHNKE